MSKRAIIKLEGSLETGFKVTLEVGEEGKAYFTEMTGHLPANFELLQCLDLWSQNNRLLKNIRITHQNAEIETSYRLQIDTCRRSAQDLQTLFKHWLESVEFQGVERRLRACLNPEKTNRILISTSDNRLRKLPWHSWEIIETSYQLEPAFITAPGLINSTIKGGKKVRVLIILANSEGIDTEADRKMLQALPSSEVTFLVKPSLSQFNDLLKDQSWDIFFFAGYSEAAQNQGRIYINCQETLTLNQFKSSLRQAIKKGLQLAIFNSCDGLNLASELEQLHLPQLIVMRTPMPDQVAHEFLKNFLNAFARGEELYVAVREARERLQGMEDQFPCASWLPIIFQNPTVVPPTWEKLSYPLESKKFKKWRQLLTLCAATVLITGMLQRLELPTYDQMMLRRPQEVADNKFVIIKITEDDFRLPQQKDRKGSLSDQALLSLLNKLKQHQPRVIGLNIFRDKTDSNNKDLVNHLQQDNFIGTCFVGDSEVIEGVPPPPELKPEQIGYVDVYPDDNDIMRRAVLRIEPNPADRCQAKYSFSFIIAETYLKKEGIQLNVTPQGYLQLGYSVFKPLENHSSGYQTLDDRGHQILINYRSVNNSLLNFIPKQNIFTLKQALSVQETLDVVKDKIVLIGVDASSVKNHFSTLYNQDKRELISSVILHAQIASQIINAALGRRPLLGVWSIQTQVIWIWVWSLLGGLLVWRLRRAPVYLALAVSLGLLILYTFCYTSLAYNSTWIPFIPAAIVFVITGCCFLGYRELSR